MHKDMAMDLISSLFDIASSQDMFFFFWLNEVATVLELAICLPSFILLVCMTMYNIGFSERLINCRGTGDTIHLH